MIAFRDAFALYWCRAYPAILVLGVIAFAYEVFCPVKHTRWFDGLAGLFVGLAISGAVASRRS